jgi:hypothetical protein
MLKKKNRFLLKQKEGGHALWFHVEHLQIQSGDTSVPPPSLQGSDESFTIPKIVKPVGKNFALPGFPFDVQLNVALPPDFGQNTATNATTEDSKLSKLSKFIQNRPKLDAFVVTVSKIREHTASIVDIDLMDNTISLRGSAAYIDTVLDGHQVDVGGRMKMNTSGQIKKGHVIGAVNRFFGLPECQSIFTSYFRNLSLPDGSEIPSQQLQVGLKTCTVYRYSPVWTALGGLICEHSRPPNTGRTSASAITRCHYFVGGIYQVSDAYQVVTKVSNEKEGFFSSPILEVSFGLKESFGNNSTKSGIQCAVRCPLLRPQDASWGIGCTFTPLS